MTPDSTLPTVPLCAGFAPTRPSTLACAALLSALLPLAQAQPPTAPLPVPSATSVPLRSSAEGWQVCQTQKADPVTPLACFQAWAAAQTTTASAIPAQAPSVTTAAANAATGKAATPVLLLPALNTEAPDGQPIGCKNLKHSPQSRFWELQRGTDCDTFTVRGFRPLSLAVATGNTVNQQPTSGNTLNNSTVSQAFTKTDAKIALTVRTKIAKGLLKSSEDDESDHDALWFAYSQKSY